MAKEHVVYNPCNDECQTVTSGRLVDGLPVLRCIGCSSEWIEREAPAAPPVVAPTAPTDAPPPTSPARSAAPPVAPSEAAAPRPTADPGPTASEKVVRPRLLQTVLDGRNIRALAEFYRQLLGLAYRPGDAPPFRGSDDAEWLVLTHPDGRRALAFQADDRHVPPTWPRPGVPQQLHLDLAVGDAADLDAVARRVADLGGRVLSDRSSDADEPLIVFADPAGHPFCVSVA